MKEAAELAESTQILMNVSEFTDISTATDSLISSIQAFKYTAEESMDVVDILNTIGNNYAISTADLAQSLTKSSGSLVAANGTLQEAVALTAAANTIIQDADVVGTALKTVAMRLRGTSVEEMEEEGLDTEGAVESKSKLQSKIKSLSGVDILTDTGAYKSTYQILSEISKVWEDISDINQAALLELLAGKRAGSVMSAILQNPDTLKDAFESANNAAGSALKENETYLDSIQGKMDLFTNAVQTMWENAIGSEVVKTIVEIGTWLIKLVDNIGLINSVLIATSLIIMKINHMSLIEFFGSISKSIVDVATKFVNLGKGMIATNTAVAQSTELTTVSSLKNAMAVARVDDANKSAILSQLGLTGANKTQGISRDALTASTISAMVAEGKLTQTQANTIMSLLGIRAASNEVNAARMNEILTTAGLDKVQRGQIITQLGLSGSLKKLNADEVMNALVTAGMSKEDAKAIVAKLGLTAANKGLAASFMVLWKAMLPMLALMAGVAVIWGVIKLIDHVVVTTEELTEELNDLKTELQDIQSEIETVNSELETMEERMAELLAKDSLSFVEQEELDRLQKENNELQRRLDLLEEEEKIKQDQAAKTFVQTMESYDDKIYKRGGEMNWWERLTAQDISEYAYSQSKYIDKLMHEYDTVLKVDSGDLDRSVLVDELSADWYSERIGEEVQAMVEAADGLDYYVGDNLTDQQKEVNEWLDYVYNTQDKLAIMRGGENAKTNTLNRIFDKDENDAISESIDGYVEALKNGDKSAKQSIRNIIDQNDALEEDILATGLSIDDAVEYFTSFASVANYTTIEGKVKEIEEATKRLNDALGTINVNNIDSIKQSLLNKGWVDTDGKLMSDVIAEYFGGESGGISIETQAEIERLIQQIYDGKISVENALRQFEYFGIESTLDIYISEVQTNFKDVFVELEDADGLIDTFEELGETIGSTADALKVFNKAEAEMANSGRVSIETALQLMEYTDDYGSILQVVDGKLRLVDNAEEVLIQTRIDAIKTSAQASLSDATNAYNKAQLATQTYNDALTTDMSASVVASAWEKVLAAGAGLMAGIKSLVTGETWTEAYNRVYNETLSQMTGYETTYNDTGLQALVDAEAEAKSAMEAAQDRVELANQLTPETLESINDADDVDTVDDVLDDRFQNLMDYYDNRISANQAKYDQIQNDIDFLEAQGKMADANYYKDQIALLTEGEESKEAFLEAKLQGAADRLRELEVAGQKGSDEWWEAAQIYNDTLSELDDVRNTVLDLQDAIGELEWSKFEEFNTRLDNINSKLETMRDLIAPDGEEDWFDDEGNWTDKGVAVLGSYVQSLEYFKNGLNEANEALETFQSKEYNEANAKWFADNYGIHSEQEYYDYLQKLTDEQYNYASSVSDTEQEIAGMWESQVDAVEEYLGTLIESYNDYIDSVKEALDAERDLYDFKKNVQKQSKDIAALERRIASLSGSTNASDIAERRKLEAELYESRESLNDTYYDHSKQSQQEALEAESVAYEETMNRFVENLRTNLDLALQDMDTFIQGVTSAVTVNAPTILGVYESLGIALDNAIVDPWQSAIDAMGEDGYGGEEGLGLMNAWVAEGGVFSTFSTKASDYLTSIWDDSNVDPDNAFATAVSNKVSGIVSNIQKNVKIAKGYLQDLYDVRDSSVYNPDSGDGGGNGHNPPPYNPPPVIYPTVDVTLRGLMQMSKDMIIGAQSVLDANTKLVDGVKYYQDPSTTYYYKVSDLKQQNGSWIIPKRAWFYTDKPSVPRGAGGRSGRLGGGETHMKYAKGTTGTPRDQWAITDEPQFGDELTMYATPEGTLSFMRAGSTVIPADLTRELIDLPRVVDGLINRPKFDSGINMIANAINKPEIVIDMENFLKVDRVDKDTLPQLEEMMDKKIDTFAKQLNYSIKKFAR